VEGFVFYIPARAFPLHPDAAMPVETLGLYLLAHAELSEERLNAGM
jgi:hypothetical protein